MVAMVVQGKRRRKRQGGRIDTAVWTGAVARVIAVGKHLCLASRLLVLSVPIAIPALDERCEID